MGGLGDQINQYIFGKYIEKKFNLNVYYDLTYYNHKPQFSFKLNNFKVHEKFKKNIFFSLPYKYISLLRYFSKIKSLIKILSKNRVSNFYYENWKINENLKINEIKDKTYFFGYWHHKDYYLLNKKFLKNTLRLKKKSYKMNKIISKIKKDDVGIHIRGKDFLNNIHAVQLNEKYYENAVKKFLNRKRNFYIFTDDPKYSKKILANIKKIKPIFVYEYKLKDTEEFQLLQEFKFLVLSNSTFGWTSSLLNRNKKKIIIPRNWYFGIKNINNRKIKEMTTINNEKN